MTTSAIASYAILKVNWEQPARRDYLDNFVLIVAEAIRQLPDDVVVLAALQTQIRQEFDLALPLNTVKTLLNRVKKAGYVELHAGTYRRNNPALAKLNFHQIQQSVLQAHEELVGDIASFVSSKYRINWSKQEAEDALEKYLVQNQIKLLTDLRTRNLNNVIVPTPDRLKAQYVIGKYIQDLHETQSAKLEYLEMVIKGNLLANSVFMTDPSTYLRRFRNTFVFLDTSIVIYALGYTGEPRKWPSLELIELLRKNGAELRIFRHSLDEAIGILTACAERIGRKQFRDSYGPSIEYFIERGYSETDVMMFVENIESDLAHLGVLVEDKPAYSEHRYVIGEEAFLNYLKGQIKYSRDKAAERDKDSIAAIVRLRRGATFVQIEECRAIFVTSNSGLAIATRNFDEFRYQLGTAPLGLTDYEMTNLVWLKSPTLAPDLPRKRLIADCFAATQPDESLWTKYLKAIGHLEQQKRINADQYFVLRHSIQARSELMERTLGDETAFSEGTVEEILTVFEDRLRAKDVARANEAEFAKEQALAERDAEREARFGLEEKMRLEAEARQLNISLRANRFAKAILFSVSTMLAIIVGYLTYVTSPIGPLNVDPNSNLPDLVRFLALAIFFVLLVIQALSLVFGITAISLLGRATPRLAKWIEKWLKPNSVG